MKNQTIRERYAALTILSQRVLPSATAINKVACLITSRFAPAYEATEISRKNILAEHPLPDGWDKDTLPATIAEARQSAVDDLMRKLQPIRKIPETLRLTTADLPKVLKKDGGESNVEGLASIIVMLGSLYVRSEEERKIDDAAEGEETEESVEQASDGLTPDAREE